MDFSSFSFFVLLNFTVLLCHIHSFIILLLISFMIGQDEILIYEETVLFLGFTGTTHLYFKYAESRVIYLSTLRDWCRSLKWRDTCQIHKGALSTFVLYLIYIVENIAVLLASVWFLKLNVNLRFCNQKCASSLFRETPIKNDFISRRKLFIA